MLSIRIEGSRDLLLGLQDVAELHLLRTSLVPLEPDSGTWTASGYATEAAVAELESRGARVIIERGEEELRRSIEAAKGEQPEA